jgi:hypothetical protein
MLPTCHLHNLKASNPKNIFRGLCRLIKNQQQIIQNGFENIDEIMYNIYECLPFELSIKGTIIDPTDADLTEYIGNDKYTVNVLYWSTLRRLRNKTS